MDDVTMPETVAEAVEATPEVAEAVAETPSAEAVTETPAEPEAT